MAYRRDVEYIEALNPGHIDVNAEEYKRVARLLRSVFTELLRAKPKLLWESSARPLYDQRLHQAEQLAEAIGAAFAFAGPNLDAYAEAVAEAKQCLAAGDLAAERLRWLIAPMTALQTPAFRRSEPLVQWEDLREMTSFLDRLAEERLQDEINRIRPRAEALYETAAHNYTRSRNTEQRAREACVIGIRKAFGKLPDFKANSEMAETIIENTPGLAAEMNEAAFLDDDVRLAGQGIVPPFGVDSTDFSETHQGIMNRAAAVKYTGPTWDVKDTWDWHGPGGDLEAEHKFKLEWIHAYGPVIEAAAAEYGIPAWVLAGVVYMEIGGKPLWMDDAADWARRKGLYPGNPDATSYGPMAIQIGTAAKALGYDPNNLTDKQRAQIIASLKDPVQSVMIAAKVLSDEKQSTPFAYAQPGDMTPAQGGRLAAGYNGGPDWNTDHPQSYATTFDQHRDEATGALRSKPK